MYVRFHPVLHLPFFYVLFPVSQVAGWSEAREPACTLLGYLMGKFGPQPKSLIVRSEFKKKNSQLLWKGCQLFIREPLAVLHFERL